MSLEQFAPNNKEEKKEEELSPELKEVAKHHKGVPLGILSKKTAEIRKEQDELLK